MFHLLSLVHVAAFSFYLHSLHFLTNAVCNAAFSLGIQLLSFLFTTLRRLNSATTTPLTSQLLINGMLLTIKYNQTL